MLSDVAFCLSMLAVVVVARIVGARARLPTSVLLTLLGLVYAFLPGPNLVLRPDIVLYVLVPPLLYSAALNSSLLALRANLRSVVSLSVLLVLISAVAVGATIALVVPGVTLALGLAFGAAVAPPDPVASRSVASRAHLPARLATLIEGEGLLNDATALTTYQVAIAAAVAGVGFSVPASLLRFVLDAAGGLVLGAVLALLRRVLQPVLSDPLVSNAVSLGTPFAAYAAGTALHVSGVLAVVVVALIVGHDSPRFSSGAGRLQTTAVWQFVDFLLEGFVFLLIGQQLPRVIRGLHPYSQGEILLAAITSVGLVLAVRPAFLFFGNILPRVLRTRLGERVGAGPAPLTWREIIALTWSGTRGVITLAIVYALPLRTHLGTLLVGRDLLLFCAYLVVLVTLVGQGLTFAPLLRRLRLGTSARDAVRQRNQARGAAVDAALVELEVLTRRGEVPPAVLGDLRRQLESQQRHYKARLDASLLSGEGAPEMPPSYEAAFRARRALIDAKREELVRWRDAGRLSDSDLRRLQAELDHEERVLPDPG